MIRGRTLHLLSIVSLLLLGGTSASAQCLPPDDYEPNDGCATATPLGGGAFLTTTIRGGDRDYYRFEVPAGGTIDVAMFSDDYQGIIDHTLTLYADDCATQLVTDDGWFGQVDVSWHNAGVEAEEVVLRVITWSTHAGQCAFGTMLVHGVVSECTGGIDLDDALESNDTVVTSLPPLADGLYTDLLLRPAYDRDDYRVDVPAGETLTFALDYDAASANLDTTLLTPELNILADGVDTPQGNTLTWFNGTGADQVCSVRVRGYGPSVLDWSLPYDGCMLYDLRLTRGATSAVTPLCFGDGSTSASGAPADCPCGNPGALGEGCANSHGHGAILTASGSTSTAADDLVITVAQARRNQPCLLLQGATNIALPYKDGVLCAGNPTRRVEVVLLDTSGVGSTAGSVVAGGHVLPGQTRYYQAWYRDPFDVAPCDGRSNFTHALEVVWH